MPDVPITRMRSPVVISVSAQTEESETLSVNLLAEVGMIGRAGLQSMGSSWGDYNYEVVKTRGHGMGI